MNSNFKDLPVGFSLALAQNLNALDYFAALPDNKKEQVLEKARSITSKEEMHTFIENLKKF